MSCTQRGSVTLDGSAAAVGKLDWIFSGTTRIQEQDGIFGSHRLAQVAADFGR